MSRGNYNAANCDDFVTRGDTSKVIERCEKAIKEIRSDMGHSVWESKDEVTAEIKSVKEQQQREAIANGLVRQEKETAKRRNSNRLIGNFFNR